MQMVTVVARENFAYNGINRQRGEVFDAPSDDATVLEAIGKVARPAKAPVVRHEDLQAPSDPSEVPVTVGRKYRRKDMVSES